MNAIPYPSSACGDSPGNGRIDAAMSRLFPLLGGDVCDWARVMVSCRRSNLPAVRADRLRAAAEFRQAMADQRKGEGAMQLYTFRTFHPAYNNTVTIDTIASTAEAALASVQRFVKRQNAGLVRCKVKGRVRMPRHIHDLRREG